MNDTKIIAMVTVLAVAAIGGGTLLLLRPAKSAPNNTTPIAGTAADATQRDSHQAHEDIYAMRAENPRRRQELQQSGARAEHPVVRGPRSPEDIVNIQTIMSKKGETEGSWEFRYQVPARTWLIITEVEARRGLGSGFEGVAVSLRDGGAFPQDFVRRLLKGGFRVHGQWRSSTGFTVHPGAELVVSSTVEFTQLQITGYYWRLEENADGK